MTTNRPTITTIPHVDALSLWINRGIEALWLSAIVLVPLAFFDRQYAISEAVIAYVEVPKIALLRTIAGFTAMLWLMEWGISRKAATAPFTQNQETPTEATTRVLAWLMGLPGRSRGLVPKILPRLNEQPGRWLMLSVWLYLGTVLLGTIFSASFSVSLWGEVPGQDGYSAYTIVAYAVLFGAIATHLRTVPQLWRLLGAIIVMGVLVSGYSALQHYSHDFLNLTELSGGGAESRTTAIMGNSIFAAAVMSMTIPISLFVAAAHLRDPYGSSGKPERNLGKWIPAFLVASVWVLILTVQLIGITFTFSRGPWMGAILALIATGGMTAVFAGWSALGRITVLLGVATGVTLAVVQWDIPISSVRLWLGATLTLAVFIGITTVLGWRILGRAGLALGVGTVLAITVMFVPSWFSNGLEPVGNQSAAATESSSFGDTKTAQRFSSIGGSISSGALGGRVDTWRVSWEIIRDRPWFEFDDLSFPWIRPFLGYGPDLFRYTYLLKSVPQGGDSPVEPDHAHNYFINNAVDLGILGFLSSLGIFAAVFLVGGYLLIWQRNSVPPLLTLVLIGVLATLAGRFLEMMVGLARVSDLTILWAILGMFAALPAVMAHAGQEPTPQPSRQASRSSRRAARRTSQSTLAIGWPSFLRLAIVAWLIGGIGILIWVKNVNYVRASVEVGEAVAHYRTGDFQASLSSLDKAIELAPDISPYYHYRAQVYFAYQVIDGVTPELACSQQTQIPYGGCLNIKSFESNLQGVNERPFYFRSRWALANSALNLKQDEIAIRLYDEVLSMVPNSKTMQKEFAATYIALAEAYVSSEVSDLALVPLDKALKIFNNETEYAKVISKTRFFQGLALKDLGRWSQASESLELSLNTPFSEALLGRTHKALAEIYGELGKTDLAKNHRAITEQLASELLDRGDLESQGRQHEKSRETVELALELTVSDDTRFRAEYQLITVSSLLGDHEYINEHENRVKRMEEVIFQEAMAAISDGQLQQAAESLALIFKFTKNVDLQLRVHGMLLQIFEDTGRSPIAEEHRSQALQFTQNLMRIAANEESKNRHQAAADAFERSIKLSPDPSLVWEAHDRLATIYTSLGQTRLAKEHQRQRQNVGKGVFLSAIDLKDRNQLTDAIAMIKTSLKLSMPEDSQIQAHQTLAEIYQELDESESAQFHLSQIKDLAQGLYDRALKYRANNQLTQAKSSIERVLNVIADQDSPGQWRQTLSEIYTELGLNELAEEQLSLAKEISDGVFQTGLALRDRNQLTDAIETIKHSLVLMISEESKYQAHQTLAEIYEGLGEAESAQHHRIQILDLAKGLMARADDEDRQNRHQLAADLFEMSIKIGPDASLVRRAHARLVDIYTGLGQTDLAELHRRLAQI